MEVYAFMVKNKNTEIEVQNNGMTVPFTNQLVNVAPVAPEAKPLIEDKKIVDYYEEAIQNIRDDRKEAQSMYEKFADMVINDCDPSSATKEAMVNLLKIKTEANDKTIKILDLWTRIHLKEKNTPSEIYAFQQNNKYEVGKVANPNVKRMIEMIEKEQK